MIPLDYDIKLEKFEKDMKNKEEMSKKLKSLFLYEYDEIIVDILNLKEDLFIDQIKEGVSLVLEDLYSDISLNDERLLLLFNKNIEEIKAKYNHDHFLINKALISYNKISKRRTNYENLLKLYRKHCIYTDDYAMHNCSSDKDNTNCHFVIIYESDINKEIKFVACENCKKVYYSSFILARCNKCKIDYYTSLLSQDENPDLLLATWENYHCPQLINEKMKCIKCHEYFYINMKNGFLTCINKKCQFVSKPTRILWTCSICKKEFKGGVIPYNPLDIQVIKKLVSQTLLLKHKAHPQYVPCCNLNTTCTDFYHKKTCHGLLYEGELDDNKIIVCEKCRAFNYYDRFQWTCPKCGKRFKTNLNNDEEKKKIEDDKKIIDDEKKKTQEEVRQKKYSYKKEKEQVEEKKETQKIEEKIEEQKTEDKKEEKQIDNNENENEKSKAQIQKFKEKNIIEEKEKEEKDIKEEKKEETKEEKKSFKKKFRAYRDRIQSSKTVSEMKEVDKPINDQIIIEEFDAKFKSPRKKWKMKNQYINFHKMRMDGKDEKEENEKKEKEEKEKREKEEREKREKEEKEKEEKERKEKEEREKREKEEKEKREKEEKEKREKEEKEKEEKERKEREEKENEENKQKNGKKSTYEFSSNIMKEENISGRGWFRKKAEKMEKEAKETKETESKTVKSEYSQKEIESLENELSDENIEDKNNISLPLKVLSDEEDDEKKGDGKESENKKNDKLNQEKKESKKTKGMEILESEEQNKEEKYSFKKKKSILEIVPPIKISMSKIPGISEHLFNHINKRMNAILNRCKIPLFNIDEYIFDEKLGEGSYAVIFSVYKSTDIYQKKYALKKIIAKTLTEIDKFTKEFELIHSCDHPNIMKIYGICIRMLDQTTYALYVLMELSYSDWEKEIKEHFMKKQFYTENELIGILRQLASALSFLQQNLRISHRDIKPQNVLLYTNNIYKIGDFGEAKEANLNKEINTLRGTELFMSPALYSGLKNEQNDVSHDPYKSDVFSLGFCFLYAASLNFNLLYQVREINNSKRMNDILQQQLHKKYSNTFMNILSHMIDIDEYKRFDFSQLINFIEENYDEKGNLKNSQNDKDKKNETFNKFKDRKNK